MDPNPEPHHGDDRGKNGGGGSGGAKRKAAFGGDVGVGSPTSESPSSAFSIPKRKKVRDGLVGK